MATSGSYNANSFSIGGESPNYIWVQWQLASQNVGGNYSTINWQTFFHFTDSDAQLNNGSTNSNVGGLWSNGGLVHSYTGDFATRDIELASGSFNIGADGGGNSVLQLGVSIVIYETGTSAGTSQVWSLPTIPRYANVTSFTNSSPTDQEFTLYADTDAAANISFSIDGGASYSGGGGGTSASQTFSDLISGHTYVCYVQSQSQASGLVTYAGPIDLTTLVQNQFFGKRVL
jgi:hypothetical protein